MVLADRQHIEAVAIMRRMLEAVASIVAQRDELIGALRAIRTRSQSTPSSPRARRCSRRTEPWSPSASTRWLATPSSSSTEAPMAERSGC